MATLPGGFSPKNALLQASSTLNPYDNRNYDVFTNAGSTVGGGVSRVDGDPNAVAYSIGGTNYNYAGHPISGSVQGASYYNTNTGRMETYGQPTANTGLNTGSSGSGSGTSRPSYDPLQVAQYDQAIGLVNDNLGRLDGQLGIATGNIDRQYGIGVNELNSSKSQAQNTRDTQSTQNRQSFVTNRNNINDQYSQGLRGLLRLLGAYGAGGGSDAFLAGNAAADVANAQRAGASQTFSQNQSGIDTAWGNFVNEDKLERDKLNDWKTQQVDSATRQSQSTRQNFLQQLAQLQGARAGYMGGNASLAAQPYLDQARGLNSQIDALGAINPTYTGNRPVYQSASLDSYQVAQNPQATFNPQSGGTPYQALLLGREEERRR